MHKKWFWLLLLGLLCLPPLRAQEEEVIRENVAVINVEVPVRVVFEGQPVTGLKKEDFKLYESGRRQEINGFQLIQKRLVPGASDPMPPPSRYFVLAFRVFARNNQLFEGLDHVLEHVAGPGDQMLVLINDKTAFYPNLKDRAKIRAELVASLDDACRSASAALRAALRDFEDWTNTFLRQWENQDPYASRPTIVRDFLQRYLDMLLDFKRRHLSQNIADYYYFSRHLEKVRRQKWVINFYQRELLPCLSALQEAMHIVHAVNSECEMSTNAEYAGFHLILTNLQRDIELECATGVPFPAKEISRFFNKANATFHTILLDPAFEFDSRNLELQRIGSGFQSTLRDLSAATGGKLVARKDVVSALDAVAASDDWVYLLTFSPTHPGPVGRIKVQTTDPRHTVRYERDPSPGFLREFLGRKEKETPSVRIESLTLAEKQLSLKIRDFSLAAENAGTCGLLRIRIAVADNAGQPVFEQTKVFKACSPSFTLSLSFPFLSMGRYSIVADVRDQVSGRSSTEVIQPVIR